MTAQRMCKRHGLTGHIYERSRIGKDTWRCMKCNSEKVARWRRKLKAKFVALFGGKCEICEYDRCIQALDFHHVDPASKLFGLSDGGVTRSKAKVLAELKKCVLLCCRCHREVEWGVTALPQHLVERAVQHVWQLNMEGIRLDEDLVSKASIG